MIDFFTLTTSDVVFYGLLLVIGSVVYLYIQISRWFGTESDYLSDDSNSDNDWDWEDDD